MGGSRQEDFVNWLRECVVVAAPTPWPTSASTSCASDAANDPSKPLEKSRTGIRSASPNLFSFRPLNLDALPRTKRGDLDLPLLSPVISNHASSLKVPSIREIDSVSGCTAWLAVAQFRCTKLYEGGRLVTAKTDSHSRDDDPKLCRRRARGRG
jgi:hypothetical protein